MEREGESFLGVATYYDNYLRLPKLVRVYERTPKISSRADRLRLLPSHARNRPAEIDRADQSRRSVAPIVMSRVGQDSKSFFRTRCM